MNKLFGKTKRLKDRAKKKEREELNAENAFLHGRKHNSLADNVVAANVPAGVPGGISLTTGSSGGGGSTSKSTRTLLPAASKPTVTFAQGTTSNTNNGTSIDTTPDYDIGNSLESGNSMSTSYYRGESDAAISSRGNENDIAEQLRGYSIEDVDGDGRGGPDDSAARISGGGRDRSDDSEMDNEAGQDEDMDCKLSFEERLKLHSLNLDGANYKPNSMEEEEEDRRGDRKSHHGSRRDHPKHGKSERKPRRQMTDDNDQHHLESQRRAHRHRGTDQEEKDRKLKQGIKEQLNKKLAPQHRGGNDVSATSGRSRNNDNDGESEQRRRQRREQYEQDRRIKQNIREQRDAIKDPQARAQANGRQNHTKTDPSGQTGTDDRIEQRRRRQREQAEKDRKMKQNIREQRDAVKDLRASAQVHDMDDETERRRQREQAEKDRKLKARIREQRDAAKERVNGNTGDVEDESEQRRRRQREQAEKDSKLKARIREEQNAAKSRRAGAVHGATSHRSSDPAPSRRRSREEEKYEEMEEYLRAENGLNWSDTDRPVSYENIKDDCEEDNLKDHLSSNHSTFSGEDRSRASFSTALDGALIMPAKGRSRRSQTPSGDGSDVSQNLIDMHVAQFRATAKTGTLDEEGYDGLFDDVIPDPNAPLEDFCSEELQQNQVRRHSKRMSQTTIQIDAWHQKYTLKKALELAEQTAEMEWLSSFYRCDPRWQIMKFFDEVAREGGDAPMDENLAASPLAGLFNKASVFTVWRPTSDEAIKNMMLGIATGKGLDIKGKSAKKGNISSYVPFIQIYEEPHKEHVRACIKDGQIVRVFYQSEEARLEAYGMIDDMKQFMLYAAKDAMLVLSDEFADAEDQELAMKHLMYDDVSLDIKFVDTYINSANPVFGLDITERLFWETYVMMQDCSRPTGTEWESGRGSEPAFMEMNLKSIRNSPSPGEPRSVVYQFSKTHPMEPRMLLMAYEEFGRVKPVVSDFDCFLLGSRGVRYKNPMPKEQVELVKWSIENIGELLDERVESDSKAGWNQTWFKVLKKAALKNFYPKPPKYGNADPKSYEIIEVAVSRLQETGCVRHGAECFNYFHPQEIDDEFLVISDTLPGNVKWVKVNPQQLQDLLITKIEEGFTFPINPKWVLCDPGWRRVYDKLLASQKANVQDSLNCWLPPETGLREDIDRISARHPLGFEGTYEKPDGTEVMDQMEVDFEQYLKIQRAWRKLRLVLYWIRFVREKRREREEIMAMRTNLISGS